MSFLPTLPPIIVILQFVRAMRLYGALILWEYGIGEWRMRMFNSNKIKMV